MKFIIFGPTFEISDMMFDEIKENENVMYDNYPIKNKFLYFLQRVHLNKFSFLPFKSIWRNLYLCKESITPDTCFIYGSPWIKFMYETGYIQNLKKKYPYSHHIAYLTDIHLAQKLPLEEMKEYLDKIYLFDKNIADELQLDYYPLMFSSFNVKQKKMPQYMLVFIGQSKGRTSILVPLFELLEQKKIKAKCIITNSNIKNISNNKTLEYKKGSLNPKDSLEYMLKSYCILELKSDGILALSDRVTKAIIFNKKILTNNIEIKKHKYYNPDYIQIFDKIEDIDFSFFNKDKVDYGYKGDYSPQRFLQFIENILKNNSPI